MATTTPEESGPPSFIHGGPLLRIEERVHLEAPDPLSVLKRELVLVAIAWVPLVLLATFERVVHGGWDPLLLRSEVHARLLLGVALFLCAEVSLDDRTRTTCAHIMTGHIVPPSAAAAWDAAIGRLRRLNNHAFPELSIFGIVYAVTLCSYLGVLPSNVMRWLAPAIHEAQKGWSGQTLAWWWYVLVGQPLFLFILGRCLFRWGLWSAALVSLARLRPLVRPAHADGVGGLAFLGLPLFSFRFVSLGVGVTLTSIWFDEIGRGRAKASTFASDFLTVITILLVVAVAAYAPLTPLLIQAKRAAEHAYTMLVARYVELFEHRWLRRARPDEEPLLGSSDIQSLADIGNAFKVVREMRTVLPALGEIKIQALSAMLPFAVIVLVYVVSAAEIAQSVVKKFLGG